MNFCLQTPEKLSPNSDPPFETPGSLGKVKKARRKFLFFSSHRLHSEHKRVQPLPTGTLWGIWPQNFFLSKEGKELPFIQQEFSSAAGKAAPNLLFYVHVRRKEEFRLREQEL